MCSPGVVISHRGSVFYRNPRSEAMNDDSVLPLYYRTVGAAVPLAPHYWSDGNMSDEYYSPFRRHPLLRTNVSPQTLQSKNFESQKLNSQPTDQIGFELYRFDYEAHIGAMEPLIHYTSD